MGDKSEQKVLTILAFHRLLAALLRHSNWLGLIEDSNGPITLLDVSAVDTAPSTSGATSEPFALTSRVWDLPRLPSVHSGGRLQDIDALRGSIAYGDSNSSNPSKVYNPQGEDSALDMEDEDGEHNMPQIKGKPKKKPKAEKDDKKSKCRPELLGWFLSSLSSTQFHAFSTGPRSSSADFIVRYGVNVTHLQVKHTQPLTFLTVLKECGKVAPTAEASPELQHTLAFLIMRPDARAKTVQEIGSLSGESLAAQLEVAVSKVDELKRKRMHLAIDLIKKGKLKVVILDDDQYNRFSRYREQAKYVLGGSQ
jgi:hypothetical protein